MIKMVKLQEVTPRVLSTTGGETVCNVAIIAMNDYIVFIDSGMYPNIANELREKAEKQFGLPTKYLILTHYHIDHVFGNQAFEDVEIIASTETNKAIINARDNFWTKEKIEEYIKQRPELKEKWKNLKIVLPTTVFEEELKIDSLEVRKTGGHTKGSSFVSFLDEEIVVTGDLLFSKTYPYGGDPTADPYEWIEALEQIIKLNPRVVIPGHGPLTDVEEVKRHLKYLRDTVAFIEDRVKEGFNIEKIQNDPKVPAFPYAVEKEREKMLLSRFYDVIKEKVQ